jgi:hypothetical protein
MTASILYNETSGHDAQVEGYEVDPVRKVVTVKFCAYPADPSRERIPVTIVFSQVTSVSTIMDLGEIDRNRTFGNVVQWHIAEKEGTSFIQLTGGMLAITAHAAPTLIE